MSSIFDSVAIVDIFENIVSTIRHTGVINVLDISGGLATITANNTFKKGDLVTINTNYYLIVSANDSQFVVKDDGNLNVSDNWQANAPYFMYGHGIEIANRLNEIDKASGLLKFRKYPLITLILDLEERYDNRKYYCNIKPLLLVLNITQHSIDTPERYEYNFKPIIYPLFNQLIKAVDQSGYFLSDYTYTATDRPLLGSYREGKNILNDFIDGREVNFNLNISTGMKSNCINNNIQIIE